MRKYLLFSILAISLVGCSSKQIVYTPQYCYTDQTITHSDSTVSSNTVLQCTDRPGQQAMIQRTGVDSKCEEFFFDEMRRGKVHVTRGVRCQKYDGSWEIININGNNR